MTLLMAAIGLFSAPLHATTFYEDSFAGATISPVWNTITGSPVTLDDPNDQLDYAHTAGTVRRFLNYNSGFTNKTGYLKVAISNFSGSPSIWVGFVGPSPGNNANYVSTIITGAGTYELFFNNTTGALAFDNGAGWTGTLASGTGLWSTDGGSSSSALTIGANIALDGNVFGFGFANFGNGSVFPSSSFSVDSILVDDSLVITAPGNTAPTVSISAPADATTVSSGTNVTFNASANDAEEGELSANITWNSSLDGSLGSGASVSSASLSNGVHTISASVTDSGALSGSDSITLTISIAGDSPVVNITAPSSGTTVGAGSAINFSATATDTEDGNLGASVTWSSSLDGSLGTGASISTSSLSVGTHTITAAVADSDTLTGSDAIAVTISVSGAPPVVTITGPADATTSLKGASITFTGTAVDPEEGDIASSLTWFSNVNGELGTGASLDVSRLSFGTHLITAKAIDSATLSDEDSITVTIYATPAAGAPRPNVIVIICDDAGYADFSFMDGLSGETSQVPTPNLEALAARGVTFAKAYVAANCQPTRAAMMTGAYQQRIGNESVGNNHFLRSQVFEGIPVDRETIWDRMKALGYRTGAIGKWHLGQIEDLAPTATTLGMLGNRPQNQGIDEFYGFWHGSRNYTVGTYNQNGVSDPNHVLQIRYLREAFIHPDGSKSDTVVEYDKFVNVPSAPKYMTNILGDYAEQFVADHYDDPEPFFLYVSHPAPHKPWTNESPDYNDPAITGLTPNNRRQVASMMITMDKEIGQLMDKLEDPNGDGNTSDSITDNTLVVFVNDNGGVAGMESGVNGTDNGKLRGFKGSSFDGGIRVPMIFAGAGVDPAQEGSVYHRPVHGIDILPTAVALAGGTIDPVADEVDGTNILPFINGVSAGDPHDVIVHKWRGSFAVIRGDHKLQNSRNVNAAPQFYELYRSTNGSVDIDPGETSDLIGNSANDALVEQLKRDLTNHEAFFDKPRYAILANTLETEPINIFDHHVFRPGLNNDWSGNADVAVDPVTGTRNWYEAGTTTARFLFNTDSFAGAILEFPVFNADYTANNDYRRKTGMEYMLNKMIFSGDYAETVNHEATLPGLPVIFTNDLDGIAPTLAVEATQSASGTFCFNLDLDVIMYHDLTITGEGDSVLKIGGEVSEYFESRGLKKEGSSNAEVNGARSYSGDTTLDGGSLTLGQANPNDEASAVSIAAGATLNLTYSGTDTIDKLFIGGVQQAAGVYEAVGNPGSGTELAQITGSGTLTVVSEPVVTGYQLWQDQNASGAPFTGDHDSDSVPNGIEYFMGETGNSFTVIPCLDASRSVLWPIGANYVGSYGPDFFLETSPDLQGWNPVAIGDVTLIPGVSLAYTLPTVSNANFLRLAVNPD